MGWIGSWEASEIRLQHGHQKLGTGTAPEAPSSSEEGGCLPITLLGCVLLNPQPVFGVTLG